MLSGRFYGRELTPSITSSLLNAYSKSPRAEQMDLTKAQLSELSFEEKMNTKFSSNELALLREIAADRNRRLEEVSAWLSEEEQVLIADLMKVGITVGSVWDLVKRKNDYASAIPVLLRHLRLPYSDRTREGIARSLAAPSEVLFAAWPDLADQYVKTPGGKGTRSPIETEIYVLSAKDGIACALAAATTEAMLPSLIKLIDDPRNGESRILLLSALKRSKSDVAVSAVERLSADPTFAREIGSWRKSSARKSRKV